MTVRIIAITVVMVLYGALAYADECNSLRYVDNGNGTVIDCRSGLTWLKNANCLDIVNGVDKSGGSLTWYAAMDWAAGLGNGLCGLSDGSLAGDWRLPTKTEMMAMIASAKKQGFTMPILTNAPGTAKWSNGNLFDNVLNNNYWTATTHTSETSAWYVSLYNGSVDYYVKNGMIYVWPVRVRQFVTFGDVSVE